MAKKKKKKGFDVLQHKLVPRHEVLPKTKTKDLMKEYGIKIEQFPRILESDPAMRAIGAKAGQVVKITRDSLTAGEAVSYRVVVEG